MPLVTKLLHFFRKLTRFIAFCVFDSSHSRLAPQDHRYQQQQHYSTMSGVPPTRMNQQIFKGKKKAAVGGHRLLKKKADALKVRGSSRVGFGDDGNFSIR
jgi:hypothetical protein